MNLLKHNLTRLIQQFVSVLEHLSQKQDRRRSGVDPYAGKDSFGQRPVYCPAPVRTGDGPFRQQ